jgi:4-amino-4-deoxy-L-arabinose transferase-like glycosyltransferase
MKKRITTILIFLAIISSSIYFGLPRLHNFTGVDEPYWSYDRVPRFWNSIAAHKWRSTNLCDKPGITLAIVSGAGLPIIGENPKNYQSIRYEAKTPDQVQRIRDIYYYLRLPVFIFTLLMLPVFYFLIRKLLGTRIARFSLIFIGFSPVLLGISLIINSDAMLWILTALSTLSLFVFFKTGEKKYLLLSGFLLGLSVITKFVANVLFVYFFFIFLLEYIFYAHKNVEIGKYLKASFLNLLILLGTTMLTAFVFFPATWMKFSTLLNATITNPVFSSTGPLLLGIIVILGIDVLALRGKFSNIIFNFFAKYKNIITKSIAGVFILLIVIIFLHVFFRVNIHNIDIQGLISSPKGIGSSSQNLDASDASVKKIIASSEETGIGRIIQDYPGAILADLYSLLFSISPLVLFCLLAAIFLIWRQKELERDSITVIYIIVFILLFYLGSTVNNVITTVRYQIMVYPLAFIAAAIGISQMLNNKKINKFIPSHTMYIVSIMILFASLYFIKPNFLAYASEVLPHDYIVNLKGMGEGSFEAATYLNNLPGAHDMTIWSDKGAVCEAFVGKCYIDFKKKTFADNKFDYFVVSTDRKSRTLKMSNGVDAFINFKSLYSEDKPQFNVIIGRREINFVRVIKAENNTVLQQ